jgi:predicted GTPase
VAFTATQIPNIEGRLYPPALSGPLYPQGVPIHPESDLLPLIHSHQIDQVVFAYSDLSHEAVMHKASQVLAAGADYRLMGARRTQLVSHKPVVAIAAVRTGCGKSQTTRYVAHLLRGAGYRVVVVRHPMPYGNLAAQAVQRFADYADLERHQVTIEEREEYEPHLEAGTVVYAGVDYGRILQAAENEADVILWDGGNNDMPFYRPTFQLTITDPHRLGHETRYHPGEANVYLADALLINKVDSASAGDVAYLRQTLQTLRPGIPIVEAASPLSVDDPERIRGQRVLVVEDGPTLTHGGMTFGAGVVAAKQFGAAALLDPRPYAVGSLITTYAQYPHMTHILPAMGYGESQQADLAATINASDADLVLIATPIDLGRLIQINKPSLRVRYDLEERSQPDLASLILPCLASQG